MTHITALAPLLMVISALVVGFISGRRKDARMAADATRWRLLDEIRQHADGTNVTLCNDNADFEGPECMLTVNAHWTDYEDKRYEAANIDVCLAQAYSDMKG